MTGKWRLLSFIFVIPPLPKGTLPLGGKLWERLGGGERAYGSRGERLIFSTRLAHAMRSFHSTLFV